MIRGFLVEKLSAERGDIAAGEIDVAYTHKLRDVKPMDGGAPAVEIQYEFTISYRQKKKEVGHIRIGGRIIWDADVEKIISAWAKKKQLEGPIAEDLVNAIYHRGLVLAMTFVETMKMPSAIPLPRVSVRKKEESGKSA